MGRSSWEEPIGQARLNRMLRNAELDARNARALARVALETGGNVAAERQLRVLSRLGDERQLRGIPAIGRGVAGAINGSVPGRDLRSGRRSR